MGWLLAGSAIPTKGSQPLCRENETDQQNRIRSYFLGGDKVVYGKREGELLSEEQACISLNREMQIHPGITRRCVCIENSHHRSRKFSVDYY
jgi:hypothetical protein